MARPVTHHVEGKILGRTTRLFRRVPVDGDAAHPLSVSPLDLPPALVFTLADEGEAAVLTDPVAVARWHMHHPRAEVRVHAAG